MSLPSDKSGLRGSSLGTCAAALMALAFSPGVVSADETQAREILKAMSDYLVAQTSLSFDYQSNAEIVTSDDQKLMIASSGSLALERPGRIHVTRTGGFADVEATFDGDTLSLLNKTTNTFAQTAFSGTIDALIDTLRDDFARPLPAADLLLADPLGAIEPLITDVKDLGSGVIDGIECDHLAFRTAEVDWQLWIAQGEAPYPCRYVITTTSVTGWPQYTIDITNWGAGSIAASFTFEAPDGATEVDPAALVDFDEIAGIYIQGGQ